MKNMKKIRSIKMVIALFTLFVLFACGKSYPVYETETVRIKPPLSLLEPVPVSPFTGSTNEDLLLYTLTLEENLNLCNTRLSVVKKSVE